MDHHKTIDLLLYFDRCYRLRMPLCHSIACSTFHECVLSGEKPFAYKNSTY